MLEKTLVILKPCTLQRGLVGEITHLFERKGLRLAGMKMMQLTDELLSEHYAPVSYTHLDVYKRQLVDRVVNKMESRTMEFMDLLNEPAK